MKIHLDKSKVKRELVTGSKYLITGRILQVVDDLIKKLLQIADIYTASHGYKYFEQDNTKQNNFRKRKKLKD